jgi:hypothetical protein
VGTASKATVGISIYAEPPFPVKAIWAEFLRLTSPDDFLTVYSMDSARMPINGFRWDQQRCAGDQVLWGQGLMRNNFLYFSLLLGVFVFLVMAFFWVYMKERLKGRFRRRSAPKPIRKEEFYCVKSSLKQINENFCVAQILFTNRKDCTLAPQSESHHAASED